MAVIAIPKRSGVSMKLNGGTNPSTGGMIVKSVSLGGVRPAADNELILNVVELAAQVLEYPLVRTEKTVVTSLERDG